MIKEAMLYTTTEGKDVICLLCAHCCRIKDSKFGICGVRQNKSGRLYTHVYAEVIASHVDPIEKKPLYHFLPGTAAYSIATVGCNFQCAFCQNWQISQINMKDASEHGTYELKPPEVVREAVKNNCRSIAYTYTEPTIFFEYAVDISKIAREKGIKNVFVTNGFMTPKAIDILSGCVDACNIDLKFFDDDKYRKICNGRLQPVLDSIKNIKKMNIWLEITTLIIPGLNDSDAELNRIAEFIASVDTGIPWHINSFHPDYKYSNAHSTPALTLKKAKNIGKKNNLQYIYIGNHNNESNDTVCAGCNEVLIKRNNFFVEKNIIKNGLCPACNMPVPGIWK